jgi:hypothetical protein
MVPQKEVARLEEVVHQLQKERATSLMDLLKMRQEREQARGLAVEAAAHCGCSCMECQSVSEKIQQAAKGWERLTPV